MNISLTWLPFLCSSSLFMIHAEVCITLSSIKSTCITILVLDGFLFFFLQPSTDKQILQTQIITGLVWLKISFRFWVLRLIKYSSSLMLTSHLQLSWFLWWGSILAREKRKSSSGKEWRTIVNESMETKEKSWRSCYFPCFSFCNHYCIFLQTSKNNETS